MSDNLMMVVRYIFAMLMTAAVQRGWLHIENVDATVQLAVDFVGQAFAFIPVIYAAIFVKNTPKAADPAA